MNIHFVEIIKLVNYHKSINYGLVSDEIKNLFLHTRNVSRSDSILRTINGYTELTHDYNISNDECFNRITLNLEHIKQTLYDHISYNPGINLECLIRFLGFRNEIDHNFTTLNILNLMGG